MHETAGLLSLLVSGLENNVGTGITAYGPQAATDLALLILRYEHELREVRNAMDEESAAARRTMTGGHPSWKKGKLSSPSSGGYDHRLSSDEISDGKVGKLEMRGLLQLVAGYLDSLPNIGGWPSEAEVGEIGITLAKAADRQSDLIDRLLSEKPRL